jgi:hypothetical protein
MSKRKSPTNVDILFLGLYHLVMVLLFVYFLISIWPAYTTGENGKLIMEGTFKIFKETITISSETRFILLVIIAAALGSYVHTATSFVSYVGNKRLVMSWAWWYILRPFIGMALALVFYFVVRAGLLSTSTNAEEISVFGIAAVAGMVGMFSKQASDKLEEVFKNLFKTKEGEGDDARKDKLEEETSAKEIMLPINKISFYTIPSDKEPKDINLSEIYKLLNETVTRIPVLDENNILKYLIHQSIIYKFIFDKSVAASKEGKTFDLKALTLEDFLKHEGIKELVTDAIAFVSNDSTIKDAKEAMEAVENCQDVFVTETGSREEEILGWLTNVAVSKSLSG